MALLKLSRERSPVLVNSRDSRVLLCSLLFGNHVYGLGKAQLSARYKLAKRSEETLNWVGSVLVSLCQGPTFCL